MIGNRGKIRCGTTATGAIVRGHVDLTMVAVDHIGRFICREVVVVNPFREFRCRAGVAAARIQIVIHHDNATDIIVAIDRKAVGQNTDHPRMLPGLRRGLGNTNRDAMIVVIRPVHERVPVAVVQKCHVIMNNLIVNRNDGAVGVFIIVENLCATQGHANSPQRGVR